MGRMEPKPIGNAFKVNRGKGDKDAIAATYIIVTDRYLSRQGLTVAIARHNKCTRVIAKNCNLLVTSYCCCLMLRKVTYHSVRLSQVQVHKVLDLSDSIVSHSFASDAGTCS